RPPPCSSLFPYTTLFRSEARFGRVSRNVVVALAYDTARCGIHGIANAAMATPENVRDGLERIRWMPATNGGPATYIQFGPWDHRSEEHTSELQSRGHLVC